MSWQNSNKYIFWCRFTVFIELNYVLGRHILGRREQQSIENNYNKGNAVMAVVHPF